MSGINVFLILKVFLKLRDTTAYVVDGLMDNEVLKSSIHSTDTNGYSEAIFAVTHLLGITFALNFTFCRFRC